MFFQLQYAEKRFVRKIKDSTHLFSVAEQLWESVGTNDMKAVYRLIVIFEADVNAIHGQVLPNISLTIIQHNEVVWTWNPDQNFYVDYGTSRSSYPEGENEDQIIHEGFDGCSLLHLACQTCDIGMVELLLQHGANVNACDLRNQTPLHHSIMRGRIGIAKFLLTRWFFTVRVNDSNSSVAFLLIDSFAF